MLRICLEEMWKIATTLREKHRLRTLRRKRKKGKTRAGGQEIFERTKRGGGRSVQEIARCGKLAWLATQGDSGRI